MKTKIFKNKRESSTATLELITGRVTVSGNPDDGGKINDVIQVILDKYPIIKYI